MEKSSKSTPTFAKGDRVVLISRNREYEDIYPASLVGKVGVVVKTNTITTEVDFGDNVTRVPWIENLRFAKSHYIQKFKEAYEN